MRANDLHPIHAAEDASKLAALIAAYEAGDEVPPPVVVDSTEGYVALCGSHRILAMREVYGYDDVADLVVVVDEHDIDCGDDEQAAEALERYLSGDWTGDVADAVRPFLACLPADARAALEGQV